MPEYRKAEHVSLVADKSTAEWSKQGSIDQMLKVYQDFDPAVKQLISKVDPAGLNVWRLMDMEKLPSWGPY